MDGTIYKTVTAKIIASMEKAGDSWEFPWRKSGASSSPVNASTSKHYRGVNTVILWCEQDSGGYDNNVWATYKQWAGMGAQVKQGQKATMITIYKPIVGRKVNEVGETVDNRYSMLKAAFVFNAAQVDGYVMPAKPEPTAIEAIASAESYVSNLHADIRHGGGRAYYRPSTDTIQLPEREAFLSTEGYYATLLHETVHWTGADKRLNRKLDVGFGSNGYAREELVAELGAAFLCIKLGVTNEPRADHAQYLNSWIKALKGDPKAIFQASSMAQKAVEYTDALQSEPVALAA